MLVYDYAHAVTEAQFALDVQAWASSWTVPALALLSGGKGSGAKGSGSTRSSSGPAITDRIPDHYSWVRESRADAMRFVDLDRLDKPETVAQIASLVGASTKPVKREAVERFRERVLSRARKVDATKARS
jgi:hypothetical protein